MPRTRRRPTAGSIHHVINRGNYQRTLFSKPEDYQEFLGLMARAAERVALPLLAFCLMPNHWHLVVWPTDEGQLSAYMHWLTGMHARLFQARRGQVGLGHVYQNRYRIVSVRDERQLLQLLKTLRRIRCKGGL